MFLDLLHFGSGGQALDYFLLCLVAILGTVQGVAVRYRRPDLIWLEGAPGYVLSVFLVAGSFVWFFLTDKEIFSPGLAGGELFTLFVVAFVVAVPTTRVVAWLAARVRALNVPAKRAAQEPPQEPLL